MNAIISINGPFRKRPTGKFKRDGQTPIMAACTPYWVLRTVENNVVTDRKFFSRETADAYAKNAAGC